MSLDALVVPPVSDTSGESGGKRGRRWCTVAGVSLGSYNIDLLQYKLTIEESYRS